MTRPLALVAFTAFLITSHAASAKPKVALTQIDGDASGDLHDAVAEALEGRELSLISSREVNRAVGKLGDLAELTEKDFKRLANDLEADAIVLGKLDKVGSAKTLKFRLYVHKKMAKGFTVSFKDAKSEKFRTLLHDKMLDKLGAAPDVDADDEKPARRKKAAGAAGAADAADDDDEDPLATKKAKKAKKLKQVRGDDEEDVRPKKARAARGDDDDVKPKRARADKDDDARSSRDDDKPARRADADDEDAPRRTKKRVATADDDGDVDGGIATTVEPSGRSANRVAIRLDVGVSVLQRSFTFNARADETATNPKNTSLSPVPGVRFEAEAFPLALSSPRSAAAGLGLGVDYDKTVALNVTARANGMSSTVPVKQSRYSIDALYRLAFGKTETSPTLTLGVGYGKRLFSPQIPGGTDPQLSLAIQRDTPSSEYTMIDPGLTFRLPVTRMVALSLGGRGLLITSAGSIQTGNSYGRAKVYGGDATAALEIMLGSRFALRFAGDFTQVGFTFQGLGKLSNGLDGDPKSQDVGGLADRSIGGSATLAVLY